MYLYLEWKKLYLYLTTLPEKIFPFSKLRVFADGRIYIVNPLPDDKILDRSKLKQIADNIFKCI